MFESASNLERRYDLETPDAVTIFGKEPTTGELFCVDEVDRYSGTYIIGTQGSGKSGLAINLILQDVNADRPLVVFDAHGELIDDILKRLPIWAVPKTYVLDMLDEANPFGVNLLAHGRLETDADQSAVVERIIHVFELLWPEVQGQQNLPRYLRQAIHVLLANPGSTLVDMYEFLTEPAVRTRLLKKVKDQTVKQFWKRYDKMGEAKQTATLLPLITRLESLFTGRSLIRNIVGQKVTSISFRRAIAGREIILIKLPTKKIAADAELIGRILFSQLAADIFAGRQPVSVYVDEAQHFANDDVEALYSEGRKFGVRLVIAHQRRDQLPEKLRDATMSARTKVVFQTTPDDGREMAALFPDAGGEFELSPHATAYLLDHPEQFPRNVQIFISTYLHPLAFAHGKVTIRQTEQELSEVWHGQVFADPKEMHPFPGLDGLLKEVMHTQNSNLPIPMKSVVAGFSDCGRGFHKSLRGWFTPEAFGPKDYQAPRYLCNANGWRRQPENAKEQLFHFLYHLRATMQWLAAHPVGTQKQATVTEVARMISMLPRRVAFIRSGSDGGVIRTLDTPAGLTGEAMALRLERIQAQSRLKYAHPRNQVEHDEQDTEAVGVTEVDGGNDDAAPPRWEEVA